LQVIGEIMLGRGVKRGVVGHEGQEETKEGGRKRQRQRSEKRREVIMQ
jgi:hypothetical protein